VFARRHSYQEFWLCLAVKGQDEARLKKAIIPSRAASPFSSPNSVVRNTPILNLAKILYNRKTKETRLKNLGLELSPEGGAVASLRLSVMPLAVSLMTAGPVELSNIYEALARVPSWLSR
jgi:hypothetical protein